jgi:hypothetical protein
VAVLGIAVIVALNMVAAWRRAPDPALMKSLADHVLANGEPAPIPPNAAKLFGIPSDGQPLVGPQILVEVGPPAVTYDKANRAPPDLEVGVRGIQVRPRPGTDQTDIFLLNAISDSEAYYYLTSDSGKLEKVIRMSAEPAVMQYGDAPFAAETAFWREWFADATTEAE